MKFKLTALRSFYINFLVGGLINALIILFSFTTPSGLSSTASKSESERETLLDGYLWDIFWPLKDVKQYNNNNNNNHGCRCLLLACPSMRYWSHQSLEWLKSTYIRSGHPSRVCPFPHIVYHCWVADRWEGPDARPNFQVTQRSRGLHWRRVCHRTYVCSDSNLLPIDQRSLRGAVRNLNRATCCVRWPVHQMARLSSIRPLLHHQTWQMPQQLHFSSRLLAAHFGYVLAKRLSWTLWLFLLFQNGSAWRKGSCWGDLPEKERLFLFCLFLYSPALWKLGFIEK